jgi:DNA replication protein DnaC
MKVAVAIEYLEEITQKIHQRSLDDIEKKIIESAWNGVRYEDIDSYKLQTIRKTAAGLFQRISRDTNERITKANLKAVIHRKCGNLQSDIALNEFFYGRLRELKDLEYSILECQQKFTAITGFGGVGKTSLVKRFASIHRSKYDHVVWIDLRESPAVLEVMGASQLCNKYKCTMK